MNALTVALNSKVTVSAELFRGVIPISARSARPVFSPQAIPSYIDQPCREQNHRLLRGKGHGRP